MILLRRLLIICVLLGSVCVAAADDAQLLQTIAQVGPGGRGSADARVATTLLAERDLSIMAPLLEAMDTDNPVAANWYRTIFEHIVQRELKNNAASWPKSMLTDYVSDAGRRGRPRRRVLRLLDRLDAGFRTRWISGRLTDAEFRSDAVAAVLKQGDADLQNGDRNAARSAFLVAFDHARDRQQVMESARKLQSIGEEADAIRHLGLVTQWWLTGPFDAPEKSGFELVFPPESQVDLDSVYIGQNEAEFGWVRHSSEDALGQINLVNVLRKADEAVGYAWTEISVTRPVKAQLRCGADDCCKVWLNGKVVSEHEQWLNGTRFDRFIEEITLQEGRNSILVKVCQGPQHRNPEVFNNWSMQLRLCDKEGRGIAFESALAAEDTQ